MVVSGGVMEDICTVVFWCTWMVALASTLTRVPSAEKQPAEFEFLAKYMGDLMTLYVMRI